MAVHFNSDRTFLPVNRTNIETMQTFIAKQNLSSPSVSLNDTFNTVFQKFEDLAHSKLNSSIEPFCHSVVVFFSDSSLDPELTNQIERLQLQLTQRVDIFTYTFGGLVVDPTIAQDIACSFHGEWFGVGSKAQPDINDVMLKYLNFYPTGMSMDHVTWTRKEEDVLSQQHTPTLTGCLPVLDRNRNAEAGVLLGMSCIDVDLRTFSNISGSTEVRRAVM